MSLKFSIENTYFLLVAHQELFDLLHGQSMGRALPCVEQTFCPTPSYPKAIIYIPLYLESCLVT